MENRTNKQKSLETRRMFLKSTGTFVAGLGLVRQSSSLAAKETRAGKEALALNGGPKTVTIPHGDADRWPLYGAQEEKEIVKLLHQPSYAPIDELEKDWKERFQVPYARAYCNGTSALTTMFFALNLPPGSEIMVPSYTFFATITPMRFFGLVPVFVDINPRTLNFDLEDAKRRLTKDTKALLPVHWIGLPCEMDRICEFAKEKGLIVLEDAGHAHGASMQGKFMGSWGRMAAFSFQASKPLPAIEGGMANYQEREYFERGSTLGHYDKPHSFPADSTYRQYQGSGLGLKLRMHPMTAGMEIDVIEHRVSDKSGKDICGQAHHALHCGGAKSQSHVTEDLKLGSGFHTFGVQWTETQYRFFVDGKRTWTAIPVSKRSQYIILSSEVQDKSWAGAIPTDGYGPLESSKAKMVVDYVRFYEPWPGPEREQQVTRLRDHQK